MHARSRSFDTLAARRARGVARLGERPAPLRGAVHRRRRSATSAGSTCPAASRVLAHPFVLAASGFMCFVEFFADKIPGVDSLWDVVHTFIRIPAGAALAAGVFGDSSRRYDARRGDPRRHARGRQPLREGRQPRGDQHVAGAVLELGGVVRRGPARSARCCGSLSRIRSRRSSSLVLLVALTIWLIPKVWRCMRGIVTRVARWFGASRAADGMTRRHAAMFTKILIANRGEIACRVARTARRMGIRTVAVYSDADADALHVAACDEAYRLGPPRRAKATWTATRSSRSRASAGAQAIHPGYGFLSENEEFAAACARRGHRVHRPAARRDRGDGLEVGGEDDHGRRPACRWCRATTATTRTPALLAREAAKIGFPVLIKATAGGGGKGMKIVDARRRIRRGAGVGAARGEGVRSATSACCIERYLTSPRHIEIQVFADTHGDAVYLFERDCSVQRRHQKVLEEAPAPGMEPARRRAMGEAAVAAAKAIGYVGAGTVEFIARAGRHVLLHGDEHAAAGRASGHRNDHRPGPGRVAAAGRLRGAAAAAAGRTRDPRPRDRGAPLRRGPGPRLPAVDRPASRIGGCRPSRRACASTPACARATKCRRSTTRCWPSSSSGARTAPPRARR